MDSPSPAESNTSSSHGQTSADPENFGHFQRLEFLGSGGMGRVYKAYDSVLQRYVALKFVSVDSAEIRERFLIEARAQATIDHPHVCKVFEAGLIDGRPYIAMQLLQGRSLKDVAGELSLEQKVRVFIQVAEGVHAAHRAGLIHRDLKPANILLEQNEDGSWNPQVLDFGLARRQEAGGMTMTGMILGTPWYMSPEQGRGESRKLDRRSDVFSLGVTFYEALTGRLPFPGETGIDVLMKVLSEEPRSLRSVDHSIPKDLEVIIMKCIEKDPEQRYESTRALTEDLTRYLDGEPLKAQPLRLHQRLMKKARKHKPLVATALIAMLVISVIGAMTIRSRIHAARQAAAAQKFGGDIKEMEAILRFAHLVPVHDVRPEKNQVRERMQMLARQLPQLGAFAEAPGNYALGKGSLALHEYDAARNYLEKAWNEGYQTPDAAYSLGLAYGSLYEKQMELARRISNRQDREKKLKQIDLQFRGPALNYLKAGSYSSAESVEYVRALIAFYEQNWNEALNYARRSASRTPWFYEVSYLEGEIHTAMGHDYQLKSEHELAMSEFEKAKRSFSEAARIGRSDERVYVGLCRMWSRIVVTANDKGEDPSDAYSQAVEACTTALKVDPDNAEALDENSFAFIQYGDHLFYSGKEPAATYYRAIHFAERALARKPGWDSPNKNAGYAYLGLAEDAANHGKPYRDLFEKAIAYYSQAHQVNPTDIISLNNLGYAYSRLANLASKEGRDPVDLSNRAIAFFLQALQLHPEDPLIYNNIGLCYQQKGGYLLRHGSDPESQFKQALAQYDRAIQLSPKYSYSLNNAGSVYGYLAEYKASRGVDPSDDVQKSLGYFDRAIEHSPGRDFALINKGSNLLVLAGYQSLKGDNPSAILKEARTSLDRALAVSRELAETHDTYAATYLVEARYLLWRNQSPLSALNRARHFAEQALRLDPTVVSAEVKLGEIEYVRGEWLIRQGRGVDCANAIQRIETILTGSISDIEPYLTAARLHMLQAAWLIQHGKTAVGDLDGALRDSQTAIQLSRNSPEALLIQSKAYCMKSTSAESIRAAADSFHSALATNPILHEELPEFPSCFQ